VSANAGASLACGLAAQAPKASAHRPLALTATLATEVKGSGILVNSMSPGWVRTDMGGKGAPRGVEEGAETAVWLALLPSTGPTGKFFRDRKPIPW